MYVLFSQFRQRDVLLDYAYVGTWIHVRRTKQFSRVPSRGLKWENKTGKLKRSIQLLDEPEYDVRNHED